MKLEPSVIQDLDPLLPRLLGGETQEQQPLFDPIPPPSRLGGVDLENTHTQKNAAIATPRPEPARNCRNCLNRAHDQCTEKQKILEGLFQKKHYIKFFTAKVILVKNMAETKQFKLNDSFALR